MTLNAGKYFLMVPDPRDLFEDIKELEIGNKFHIEIVEMDEKEFESLGEHEGW